MSHHPKLAIIGFGTMGQAICAGLVEASGYPASLIHAVDVHPAAMKAINNAKAGKTKDYPISVLDEDESNR